MAAERLAKERELVGMYLSAHPLDDYYMELTYGTMSVKEFADEETVHIEGKEIQLGGLVVDFQTRQGKKGLWGILKMEDLSGSTELRLFGNTFAQFNSYCVPGQQILVTGKYQRRYSSEELSFNITDISLLNNVKGRYIRGIRIKVNIDEVNDTLRTLLSEHAHSGSSDLGELQMVVYSGGYNRTITLNSGLRIPVNRKLVNLLDQLDIDYTILKE